MLFSCGLQIPDVHEHMVKSWSASQSVHVHASTQAFFSHVDRAEAHGYTHIPPEETVAAHLCASSITQCCRSSRPSFCSPWTGAM